MQALTKQRLQNDTETKKMWLQFCLCAALCECVKITSMLMLKWKYLIKIKVMEWIGYTTSNDIKIIGHQLSRSVGLISYNIDTADCKILWYRYMCKLLINYDFSAKCSWILTNYVVAAILDYWHALMYDQALIAQEVFVFQWHIYIYIYM